MLLFFNLFGLLCRQDFEWFLLLMRITLNSSVFDYLFLYLFLLQLNFLLSYRHNIIIPSQRFGINPIHSKTFSTFDQRTRPIRINNICSTYSTRKHTIKWETFIYLVTHTTYIHLAISRYGLGECAFLAVYCPKEIYNKKLYIYGMWWRVDGRVGLALMEDCNVDGFGIFCCCCCGG